jgi:hypothetical protein
LLFGVKPTDPAIYIVAAAVIVVVLLAASYVLLAGPHASIRWWPCGRTVSP